MNAPTYDPVAASLAAAAKAAENPPAGSYTAPAAGQTPDVFKPQAGAVAIAGAKGQKLSVTTMQKSGSNSLNVDHFLGVKPTGVIVNFAGDDARKNTDGLIALQPLHILVDYATDVAPKYSCRITPPGQGTKFFHSYDRVVMNDGVTPWDQVVAKCKSLDPKCRGDYASVDIAGVLLQPAVLITGKEILPAGKRVGFSTAIKNWDEYLAFHQEMIAQDLIIEYDDNSMEGKLVIEIGFVPKTNPNGQNYGGFTFKFLGKGDGIAIPGAQTVQKSNPAAAATVQQPQPIQAAQPTAAAAPVAEAVIIDQAPQQPAQPTAANTIPGVASATGDNPKRRSRKDAAASA